MICPMHHSLLKRNLVLGGDRECVLFSVLVSAAGAYAAANALGIAIVVLLEAIVLLALRAMARRDVWLVPILIRSWARSGPLPARSAPEGITAKY